MIKTATPDEFEQHQLLQRETATHLIAFTHQVCLLLYDGVSAPGTRPNETPDARFLQKQLARVHRRRQHPLAEQGDIEHDASTIITTAVELVVYHWREVGVALSDAFEWEVIRLLHEQDRERFPYRGDPSGPTPAR